MHINERMAALIATSGFFDDTCPPDAELAPERHTWCSLMSLPLLLEDAARNIPAFAPYLGADAQRVDHWRERLAGIGGMRIGCVWQGNPAAEFGSLRGRSMPLQALEPLAALDGVSLISLQKGAGLEQLRAVSFKERIHDLSGELDLGKDSFVDTAAVLMNLDLIITTDTSLAHLAGALGVPVWVALHRAADWRWFRTGDSSPWYPTMRLFRQRQAGDWAPVIDSMRGAIEATLR